MFKRYFWISIFLLLTACSKNDKPIVAFYYWKTNLKFSETEKEVLTDNNVGKLYIRYFDIGLHPETQAPIPISPIHFKENMQYFEIVPVVFIQNKVMLEPKLDVSDLAKKTIGLIDEINSKNKLNCTQIQIDCDWTLKSKEHYLEFIEQIKKLSKKKLSATIRLHQVKYFEKTKIPNVDSGVLMFYNMGSIAPDSLNSIYNREISGKYLSSLKKYPLHLDYALPIYSWVIHIRDQKVLGLRSKLNFRALKKDKNFVQISPVFFKVRQSNYKNGVYYEENDLLKIEAISSENLRNMAEDLNENTTQPPREILFYDLDEFNLKNYEKNIFKQIISVF